MIAPAWYLVIVLVFPPLAALSLALDYALAGSVPAWTTLWQLAANPIALVGMVLLGVLTGPLSEELGWRGYAQERLLARHKPMVASLILGGIWALWHLPLFLVRGTPQFDMGLGTPSFWLFLGVGIPVSMLMTWVYCNNGWSILSAILLHLMLNLTMNLVYPISERALLYLILLMTLTAVGMACFLGNAKGA